MVVGATATKLHLSSAAAVERRPTLLHLAAVAVLCSVSYLLGIWHHGGFSTGPAAGVGSSVSHCKLRRQVFLCSPQSTEQPEVSEPKRTAHL